MRKASTVLLEQGTQTPSPAPDLIPAERLTENLHWDWYRKRGHFTRSPPFAKGQMFRSIRVWWRRTSNLLGSPLFRPAGRAGLTVVNR